MSNNSRPIISVLMPVYNDLPHLKKAVESILNQTYSNFQFIIVNDGSTDGSLKLLKKYAQKDERIRLFDETNKGLTKELQFAIQYVQGEYIARMDGDDIACPDRFEHQVSFMQANPEILCSGTNVIYIDDDGDDIGYSDQCLEHDEIEAQLITGRGSAIYHPTMIAKTEAIKKIGGYNDKYRIGQDLDLFLRLGEVGKLANSEKRTLKFRRSYKTTTALETKSKGLKRRKEIVRNALRRRNEKDYELSISVTAPETIGEYHLKMSNKAVNSGLRKGAIKHLVKALKTPSLLYQRPKTIVKVLLKMSSFVYRSYLKIRAFFKQNKKKKTFQTRSKK